MISNEFAVWGRLISVLTTLTPAVVMIWREIDQALDDDELSPDEAVALGQLVADQIGNLKIKVRGIDILHAPAQREILGGLARVLLQLRIAMSESAE